MAMPSRKLRVCRILRAGAARRHQPEGGQVANALREHRNVGLLSKTCGTCVRRTVSRCAVVGIPKPVIPRAARPSETAIHLRTDPPHDDESHPLVSSVLAIAAVLAVAACSTTGA